MEKQILVKLAEDLLPLNKWGFTLKSEFVDIETKMPAVIYNSEFCRMKILLDYPSSGRGSWDFRIFYGRLHALDNGSVMKWNNEDYYCWHNFELVLKYLDNQSARKAANTRSTSPLDVQKFLELGLTGVLRQSEWLLRMHAMVWEYYGSRFFEIFDLRHPELWTQYTQFVKEYYDIIGISPRHFPLLDKIC